MNLSFYMYLTNVNQVLWRVPPGGVPGWWVQSVSSQSATLVSPENLSVLGPHFTPAESEPLRMGPSSNLCFDRFSV